MREENITSSGRYDKTYSGKTISQPGYSQSGWNRKQILTLITVMSAQFCILTSYSLLAPFFPQLAAEKGMDNVTIGFLFASYQLVMFIMTPIYGLWIVRIGPKFLCVAGCFLCGGSSVLFGLLYYTDLPFFTIMCFITRACEGNGAAMFMVASMTTLIKTLPGSASRTLGIIEMVAGFGYIAGPVVGAGLFALGGYPAPFLSVGVLTLILSAILFCLLPRIDTAEKQTTNFLRLFKIPGVTILFLHCFVTCLTSSYLDPSLGPFMASTFNSTTTTIGLVFGAWSGAYALFSPVFGKLADKGYLYSPVIISLFGTVLCELLIPPSPLLYSIIPNHIKFAVSVVAMTAFGIFQAGIYIAPFQAVLNLLILDGYSEDIHTYGMISGFINSAYSLGSFSGPMFAGYLTDKYKFPWATTIMSFISTAMSIVLLGYVTFMKITRRPLHPGVVPATEKLIKNDESIKDEKYTFYGSFKDESLKVDDDEANPQLINS